MTQVLHLAREEMKRADHLLYVSLKYTRTVDVIKSLIDRLISSIDSAIEGMLENSMELRKIPEVPENLGLRMDLAREIYDDETVNQMIDFGMYLKMVNRAEYQRSREFRRHVTMTAHTDTGIVEVNIDVMKEYYMKVKDYLDYCERLIFGEKELI